MLRGSESKEEFRVVELSAQYSPHEVEQKWYSFWKEQGYFKPNMNPEAPTFSIVMPPPNVTGILHVGHALNNTWQDILIRFHRMLGDNTLWLPGTDHAGIHTQMKVEELLRSQNIDRRSIGREAFIQEVWQWKEKYGGEILRQVEKLGASVDWDRLRFTMDEGLSKAVTEVFVRLYEEGLIYRGNYITNWCVSCRTALSDIEVEHDDEKGTLTFIRYPLVDEPGEIVVATTRPETMLGDTAIAVHPDDPRWNHLVGHQVKVPLVDRIIPIIADTYVDPEYGTGAVKVTPAHDPNDFQMGERHQLPQIPVIGEDGRMTEAAGPYQGLDRYEARQRIIKDLDERGAIEKQEDLIHSVGHCEKCGTVIEPLLSLQWFVKIKPLAEPALNAVRMGAIKFVPERFEKIYTNWMENIRDWCISRQIWWGHRIPAYYCDHCDHVMVAREAPEHCDVCGGPVHQDEDVLDTWFSSALWPFSTLGWPDQTEDLKTFYPTSVLSTAYDIIFFWVSRMIMQGIHFTGQKPFTTVLLHGLVRDSQGRKMSKSLGNGVDPMDVIERYGADALRMALVLSSAPGNDQRYSDERVQAASHFANKIYNAIRYVRMNLPENFVLKPLNPHHVEDVWIIQQLNQTIEKMTAWLHEFEFGQAARAIYDFLWDDYCDWYIELSKIRLREYPSDADEVLSTLIYVAEQSLKLLHPFMPFVTEELWQSIPHEGESIMIAPWPEVMPLSHQEQALATMDRVKSLIRAGRNLRAEVNLPPGQRVQFFAVADNASVLGDWRQEEVAIRELLRAQDIAWHVKSEDVAKPHHALTGVALGGSLSLLLEGVVDLEKEAARVKKMMDQTQAELERVERQLGDQKFLERAPEPVVAKAKAQREELVSRITRLKERWEDLQ
ncbi:valine--tRNA ligase [Sulfobacillus thermosulfidooxidans]|uniref:valine--tRNA ligase n=1 Tax=Sulfobacillus thermosulfidooxidans TaxID=28034 RepID=UPI0006887F6A|nr:valine--tRNA ligase [Sulfobacillus thermosulfidooxidans]